MYILKFSSFSGLSYECARGDRDEVRNYAARLIRLRRKRGHVVTCSVRRGDARYFEIGEPDGCAMVPDTAGMLRLGQEFQFRCRECGQEYDDRQEAGMCCAPSPDDYDADGNNEVRE